jgi:hypothetical protein
MPVFSSRSDDSALIAGLTQRLTQTVKDLLEQRHLYQSVSVLDQNEITVLKGVSGVPQERWFAQLVSGRWFPYPVFTQPPLDVAQKYTSNNYAHFVLPHARTYCKSCDRREPFNPLGCAELTPPPADYHHADNLLQVWAVSMQCQGCKGAPEVFLIRREAFKLILCGRAPIEHVDVSKAIPKQISRYYSNAIVAHQSGQTLSGLFQLRTCIEQWAAYLHPGLARAEDALEAYKATLPVDFKQRFPSLSTIYSDLSAAIHAAREDATLFDESAAKIVEHFDARRLFKLSDTPAARPAQP